MNVFTRVVAFGLGNGGTAGLIYMYIIVVVLFFLVNVSMAEMASMAPTAGESVLLENHSVRPSFTWVLY